MNQIPDEILLEVLDRLEAGEPTERLLSQFPEYADQLRSYLETAVQLKQISNKPLPVVKQRSKQAFLIQAETFQKEQAQKGWFQHSFLPRLIIPTASIIALLLICGILFVSASAKALPGDPLYGTKRMVEHWRILLANPEKANVLQNTFHDERIREIVELVKSNRDTTISFDGIISFMSDKQWVVSELPMLIDETIEIVGTPFIGAKAQIYGHIRGGILYADHISILTEILNTPEPTGTVTKTPTSIPTIMPSATPTPINASRTPTQTEGLEDDDPDDPEETMEPTEIEPTEEEDDDEDEPEFTSSPEPSDDLEDGKKD
jgi:hypothetical protein